MALGTAQLFPPRCPQLCSTTHTAEQLQFGPLILKKGKGEGGTCPLVGKVLQTLGLVWQEVLAPEAMLQGCAHRVCAHVGLSLEELLQD